MNRSTFYLHYENMADLLEETLEYMGSKFTGYFETDENTTMDALKEGKPEDMIFITEKHLVPYLSFIQEHRTLFFAAMTNPERFASTKSFEVLSEKLFYPVMSKFDVPEKRADVYTDVLYKGNHGNTPSLDHKWM